MQRGVEAEHREKQRQEREAMLKESHWVFDASAGGAYEIHITLGIFSDPRSLKPTEPFLSKIQQL